MVKSVLPIPKLPDQEQVQERESVDVSPSEEQAQELWDPPVGLSHLEEEQQSIVCQMLQEEADAFARDENEVGCIDNLELEINLDDDQPVRKNYVSIPKPICGVYRRLDQSQLDQQVPLGIFFPHGLCSEEGW